METHQKLIQDLGNRSLIDKLAVLEALEKKRRDEQFIKYWQAYPKQGELFSRFTADTKIFGILGGNRSGKTEMGAFISVAWALGKQFFVNEPAWEYVKDLPIPEGPCNIWVVGLSFAVLRDVIFREKLLHGRQHPPLLPKDSTIVRKISEADFQIFFANGSVITGKSADSGRDKFQSASCDLIWIDEEPDVEIFDECYQRTADCAGRILLTLTPLTDISSGATVPWVFDLYEEFKHGKKDVNFVQLSVLDNPYVPEVEKQKLQDKWQGHFEERARLYGEFVRRSGLVYNMWNPSVHMVKPFPISRDWRRIVSIDPAATGTTAAIWAAVAPGSNNLYLYREYYERDRVVSDHAKGILARNAGDPVDIWLIDPKWSIQRNAENHKQNGQLYRESGIPVREAVVGEDYGMNESREYMNATLYQTERHPKVFIFDDLKFFQWEIEHYVWDFFQKGEQKGLSKDKPRKRSDHLMNAFQYLCAMRPRGLSRQARYRSLDERRADAAVNSYT